MSQFYKYFNLIVIFVCVFSLSARITYAKKYELPNLQEMESPSWSLNHSPDELVVSVSPTRQSLQLFGSAGLVIGTSVSAVVDDKYRVKIKEALGDFDPGAVFEDRLRSRLEESMGSELSLVKAVTGMGRHNSIGEARKARFDDLTDKGHDMVLDLTITYGVFGTNGMLVTQIDGDLFLLPGGKDVWRKKLVCSPVPVLADEPTEDPTSRFAPSISGLSVDSESFDVLLENDAAELKRRIEVAVEGAVSALLTDLKLVNEDIGHYFLGKVALMDKEFELAEAHFKKAIGLSPENNEYRCAHAVAFAMQKNVDEAIRLTEAVLENDAEYGLAHYNLAWWYATEKKDASKTKVHYEKARAQNYPEMKKVEKLLKKEGSK